MSNPRVTDEQVGKFIEDRRPEGIAQMFYWSGDAIYCLALDLRDARVALAAEKALREAAEQERDKFLAQWSDAVELRERDFETLECEREATRLVARERDAALADAARKGEALERVTPDLQRMGGPLSAFAADDNRRSVFKAMAETCLAALAASDSAAWLKRKLDEARAEERERCIEAVYEIAKHTRAAMLKAEAAGRGGVASHRQSDLEMNERCCDAIRALSDGEDGR